MVERPRPAHRLTAFAVELHVRMHGRQPQIPVILSGSQIAQHPELEIVDVGIVEAVRVWRGKDRTVRFWKIGRLLARVSSMNFYPTLEAAAKANNVGIGGGACVPQAINDLPAGH